MVKQHVRIIVNKREPKIISPGVRQGASYRVITEGPDYFKVTLKGQPVLVDKCFVASANTNTWTTEPNELDEFEFEYED